MLGDTMAQEPDSVDAALERYEQQRKPDVHALGTMDHQVCSCEPCDEVLQLTLVLTGVLNRVDVDMVLEQGPLL